ncbi:hypothetical protein BC830DRAFT_1158837 [Chytriomyces sp. MP71]|nr:hypothetical protein BC830DRAFT_1158837 [Chytriomyces sp. MP71]
MSHSKQLKSEAFRQVVFRQALKEMNALQNSVVASIFLLALAFENASKGLILSINIFAKSRTAIPATMIIVNLLSLGFGPMYIYSLLNLENCQNVTLSAKIFLHLFDNGFSFFLLFKTWIVAQKHPMAGIIATLLFSNRCVWAVIDCMRSYGIQIPGGCFYVQEQLSVIGISTGGILVDLFSTSTTIVAAFRFGNIDASTKVKQLFQVLIADNVLRSLCVMAVNSFTLNYAMYGALRVIPGSPSILILIPPITGYVYTVAMNFEFEWIAIRKGIVQDGLNNTK